MAVGTWRKQTAGPSLLAHYCSTAAIQDTHWMATASSPAPSQATGPLTPLAASKMTVCSISLSPDPVFSSVFNSTKVNAVFRSCWNYEFQSSKLIWKLWFLSVTLTLELFFPIVCQPPSEPENGGYNCHPSPCHRLTQGTVIEYFCDEGYILKGGYQFRTCDNGEWKSSMQISCHSVQGTSHSCRSLIHSTRSAIWIFCRHVKYRQFSSFLANVENRESTEVY